MWYVAREFLILSLFLLLMVKPIYAIGFQSTFVADKEGWRSYVSNPSGTITDYIYWNDGYIFTGNFGDDGWFFVSPEWEEWSELYGGTISFDLKVMGEGTLKNPGLGLMLDLPSDDLQTYAYRGFAATVKGEWVSYEFQITAVRLRFLEHNLTN